MEKMIIFFLIILSLSSFGKVIKLSTLENPPLEYTVDGVQQGFVIEILNEIAKRQGDEFIYDFAPWKRAMNNVIDKVTDGVFNAAINEERKEWANYNEEVLAYESYVIFIRKGSNFTINDDFSNAAQYTLGIQLGYEYGDFDEKLEKFKKIEVSHSIISNIRKLNFSRIDMFVGDLLPTIYYAKKYGLYNTIEVLQDSEFKDLIVSLSPTYVAFSKENISKEFIEKFNNTLKEIKQDGTYDEIMSKYTN